MFGRSSYVRVGPSLEQYRCMLTNEYFHEAYKDALKNSDGRNFADFKRSTVNFFETIRNIMEHGQFSSGVSL
jgi:hypothetical protein